MTVLASHCRLVTLIEQNRVGNGVDVSLAVKEVTLQMHKTQQANCKTQKAPEL